MRSCPYRVTDGEAMADEIPDGGGRMPLPPEQPPPEPAELPGADGASGDALEAGAGPRADLDEAAPADLPPGAGRADDGPPSAPPGNAAGGGGEFDHTPAPGGEWWRGDDVRGELREDWHSTSTEAGVAAQELSHQLQQAAGTISDAVAGATYPAAAKRGLDIRWMRLSINIPAVFIALLVTYGGRTATDRMTGVLIEDGPFAPLGWVLFAVLLLGIVMVLPIGTPLAHAIGHLVQWAASGLVTVLRRGWQTPVIGYLLRLGLAAFVWSFIFAVLYVGGRGIIHWLTGA